MDEEKKEDRPTNVLTIMEMRTTPSSLSALNIKQEEIFDR